MFYLGDFALGATVYTKFTTTNPATGLPMTLAGGAVSAYCDNDTAEITAGITLVADFDGRAGLHHVTVAATSGNGYAAGKHYVLVVTAGTVGGGSVIGYIVGEFSIEARSGLRPATAGRTLLLDASGGVSLTSPQGIRKNTAFPNFTFLMFDTSGAPKTTLTGFTAKRRLDGGALADLTNVGSIAEIDATNFPGAYTIDLAAGDTNGDLVTYRFAASGARDTQLTFKTVSA